MVAAGLYRSSSCYRHNRSLAELKARFDDLPHPEGTTGGEVVARLGLINGNGNHCDYFVGQLRSAVHPREAILRGYVKTTGDGREVHARFLDEIAPSDPLPLDLRSLASWRLRPAELAERSAYVVYLFLPGADPAEMDPRCH